MTAYVNEAADNMLKLRSLERAIPSAHKSNGPQCVAIIRRPYSNVYASKQRDMIEMVAAIGYDEQDIHRQIQEIDVDELPFDILRKGQLSIARDTYDTRDVDRILAVGDHTEQNLVMQSRESLRQSREFFRTMRRQREEQMKDPDIPNRVNIPISPAVRIKRDAEITRCIVEHKTATTAVFNNPTCKRDQHYYAEFQESLKENLDPDAAFARVNATNPSVENTPANGSNETGPHSSNVPPQDTTQADFITMLQSRSR